MAELNEAKAVGQRNKGLVLARTGWRKHFTEGVSDEKAWVMGYLLENQKEWLDNLDEETKISTIGSFEKYVFPLIQNIYPNLIAADLVSVQPLTSSNSLIFFKDTRFGSNKGRVRQGQSMYSARTGWNDAAGFNYSSEVVEGETIGVGDGADTTPLSGSAALTYHPLRPGSITVTYTANNGVDIHTANDDGAGGFVGADLTSGTIDYNTGAILLTFSGAGTSPAAANIEVTYEYNSEGSSQIPQVDIVLTSVPVQSRPRKLRARWSIEAAAMLKSVHGEDAESVVTSDMANELKIETDREIIGDLLNMATANDTTGVIPKTEFSRTPDQGVALYLHRQAFVYSITEASNKIFRANRRHGANYAVVGVNLASIIQGQEGIQFQPSGQYTGSGVQFIGTLNGMWKIYMDPYMDPDTGFMGFKGGSFLDAGYVYAPWIPFYSTPTIVLDDFLGRKGLLTHYGKKPVNGLFYCLLKLVA